MWELKPSDKKEHTYMSSFVMPVARGTERKRHETRGKIQTECCLVVRMYTSCIKQKGMKKKKEPTEVGPDFME